MGQALIPEQPWQGTGDFFDPRSIPLYWFVVEDDCMLHSPADLFSAGIFQCHLGLGLFIPKLT
jgi:hypothetical protein